MKCWCVTIVYSIDWSDPVSEPETTRQDVHISGLEVDGYKTEECSVFANACARITVLGGLIPTDEYDFEGTADGDALGASSGALLGVNPAEDDVAFKNCTFKNCQLGPGVVGYKDGNIVFDDISTDGCPANCL